MSAINVEKVIGLYMKKRLEKEQLEATVKEQLKEISEAMLKLESFLMQQMEADGVTSYKTAHGTAFKTSTDFANVADWNLTLDFIREHDKYEMLERRVNKTAVRAFMEETSGTVPGVNYGTKVSINIRKPTASA